MKPPSWKRAGLGLAGIGLLVLGLAGGLALLSSTSSGLRLLVKALAIVGPDIRVEGVEGALTGPLGIRRLIVQTDTRRITLEHLRLEWQAQPLAHGRLDIDWLAAQKMTIETLRKSRDPTLLPDSLRLPARIHIRELQVAEIHLRQGFQSRIFRNARLQVSDNGAAYQLRLLALATPWAGVSGTLQIQKDAPFALGGTFQAQRASPVPVVARLKLGGKLESLEVQLVARAQGMEADASGVITPFSAVPVERLLLAGQGIDPSRLIPDAPNAKLAFSGVFEGRRDRRLLGTFSLSNSRAGRLDQQRLPLVSLVGAVVGDARQADFSALKLDLGPMGHLSGNGTWREGRLVANLHGPRLNLAGLTRSLFPTRFAADFQFTGDAAQQQFSGQFTDAAGNGQFRLTHAGQVITLREMHIDSRGATLTADGQLHLANQRAFAGRFQLSDVDPARFGRFPKARLRARGQLSGHLLPQLALHTRFELPDGTLEGRPLRGKGRFGYTQRRLQDADIDLNLAGNLLRLKGGFGRPGHALAWSIDAPALGRLGLGFNGRLTSEGTLSGTLDQPQARFTADAQALRVPGVANADRLSARFNLEATANGAMEGSMTGQGLLLGGQAVSSARIALSGRRSAHIVDIAARVPDGHGEARLQGGLNASGLWRGQILSLQSGGKWPVRLRAPAGLALSRTRQQLQHASLDVLGGRVDIATLDLQGQQLRSKGSLGNLPLAPALDLLRAPRAFATDLRVSGEWDVGLGRSVDGVARLRRVSGDVRMSDPVAPLGLQTLNLDVHAEAGRLLGTLHADSARAGEIRVQARAGIDREGWVVRVPATAPVTFTAQADVPDLRLLRPFLPVTMKADARLQLDLQGAGTFAKPTVTGTIRASGMRFAMPEEGLLIRDGRLDVQWVDDKLTVRQGVLYGTDGRIDLTGTASLRNPQAGVRLDFQRFAALARTDRRVWLSGTSKLVYREDRLQLEGDLRIDRARMAMPAASRPRLSGDVQIVGQAPRPVPAGQRFPLQLNLNIDLGPDTRFNGAGLEARLVGQIHLTNPASRLRAEGSIRVAEGQYSAYGQKLAVQRGALTFFGPVDNPGLDVLAVRIMPTVTAGVQVTGTVQRPLVSLYSDPPLTDTEKLSWLVLGHGLQNNGPNEFELLRIAAGALFSGSESGGVQRRLANALNIDSFEVRGGDAENLSSTIVSLGKRLSDRATLSYEQSLDGLSQVIKVVYRLTPHVRLEAQTGHRNSFDAFYSLEFD